MPDGALTQSFRVTPAAAAQVAAIAAREGKPGAGLRLAVEAGGCSGFQYRFAIEEVPADEDLVIDGGPARVFVDPVSLELLAGAELDWAEELIGAHFAIRNPQASSSCGCGTSFAIA
ncbi:HesB/IscA family protein [Plastoroseomonas hellenica]|uniref:Iron-sulfur cluster assembly accessory protein n=1 Tax=Plastoroseomonas hellenica TaxID=2687306 RepID=A0ABS5EZ53_9PROT|nr:iron-sulfur cluster assembly accessory protein [Plastoroseomonas hellenica]MBR0642768.1 iron-sulfur cluster assembly accessory protein [Plastoroseomonas hellenica]MBR0665559.1 iron-sulfur cluster assembly accessory protein [Plastoroseomonas hellenica]